MAAVNLIPNFRWRVVRDELREELLAVPSVELVHKFLRFDRNENENDERFRKLHIPEGSGIINAWAIHRIAEEREYDTNRETIVRVAVAMDFWYQLDDKKETQDTFDDIIDDVKTALQEPIRLDCEVELQGPVQLTIEDHRYFAGKLVHHAELQTLVEARVFEDNFR